MQIVTARQLASRLAALETAQPRVAIAGNFATPQVLAELIDQTLESYRIFSLNACRLPAPRPGVVYETPFVGPAMRGAPELEYLPMRLSLVPVLLRTARPPDIVALHVTPPRAGMVSMGVEVNILPAALEAARARGGLVVAQVNPAMPYTLGDAELPVAAIDLALEAEEPLPVHHTTAPEGITAAIGELVAGLVGDGATLQLGIGQIPDAALAALTTRRHLGVWSEMISDGVLHLDRQGALDPDRPINASFLFGSEELYAWVDNNPRIQLRRTEVANDPAAISANPAMTSINGALQVDLFAQANASYVHGRVYSGFGGQPDFVVGALHSPGGHAIVALPSWHEKTDRSTIVPSLEGPVTSFQHSVIVTEQGAAPVFGRSRKAQVRLIIEEAAHPDARAALWEAAPAAEG